MSAYQEHGLINGNDTPHNADTLANSEQGHVTDKDKVEAGSSSQSGNEGPFMQRAQQETKNPQQQMEYDYMLEKQTHGVEKYSKLGWFQLVVVLIVEAIALGSLSIPS